MTDATAMPSQNHHLTAPCSLRLRHALGLLLGIVPAISFAQHSNPTVPAGFPNVARTPGERIAGNIAPNQGRTAIIAYHNGVLFTVPEAPSSNPGSDLQVRTWDISTPANLADPVELRVKDRVIARGELTQAEDGSGKLGVRLTEIVDISDIL